MFNFTSKATVNRSFKVSELQRKVGADKTVKDDAKVIQSISLKYVLNEQTIGMKPGTIKEIYFFVIDVSNMQVPSRFIAALDGIIKLQTVFVLQSGGNELMMTAYKAGSRKGGFKYFQTEWKQQKAPVDLPMTDMLDEMYKYILQTINRYPPFKAETIGEYITRYNQIRKLDYQIGKTEQAILYEVQSKKRFEYNDRLKEYKITRDSLLNEKEYEYGKTRHEIEGFISGTHSGD